MAAPRTPAFRGRSRERREVDRLLDGVRGGESVALVIRGEPEGERGAGGGGAVGQPLQRAFGHVAPTRADGGLHQVGQCLGPDQYVSSV
jgi:hypothetical protein